jgi:hypothetical protein
MKMSITHIASTPAISLTRVMTDTNQSTVSIQNQAIQSTGHQREGIYTIPLSQPQSLV